MIKASLKLLEVPWLKKLSKSCNILVFDSWFDLFYRFLPKPAFTSSVPWRLNYFPPTIRNTAEYLYAALLVWQLSNQAQSLALTVYRFTSKSLRYWNSYGNSSKPALSLVMSLFWTEWFSHLHQNFDSSHDLSVILTLMLTDGWIRLNKKNAVDRHSAEWCVNATANVQVDVCAFSTNFKVVICEMWPELGGISNNKGGSISSE